MQFSVYTQEILGEEVNRRFSFMTHTILHDANAMQ